MQEPEGPKPKRKRGEGSVFKNGSSILWISYSDRGRKYRESAHTTDYVAAERLLKRRLAEVLTDTFVPRQNIRIDELIADVMSDYRQNGRKSTDGVEARWRLHLAEFFSRLKACDLKTDRVQRYIKHRLDQGAERATVNRELAVLKRALHLAFKAGKLKTLVYIPGLKESNVRRGFLEPDGYARMASECAKVGLWLRALFETAYTFGFRLGELRSMRCRQVNFVTGTIALETSKNGEPRTAYMTACVRELLKALCEGKGPEAFVFTRPKQRTNGTAKKLEDDSSLKDFRKTWANACVAAKVGAFHCPNCDEKIDVDTEGPYPHCGRKWRRCDLKYRGLIVHDLRRCATRGLMRAGIAQKTAMMVTGHKTISTFQRYQIVAPSDLKEATRKLELSQEMERDQLAKSNVPSFGLSSDRVARKAGQAAGIAIPIPQPPVLPN